MSTKNFRVSDGDWICPDKKWVHEGSRIGVRLVDGGFLRSFGHFTYLRSLVPQTGWRWRTADSRAGRRILVSSRWGLSGAFVLTMSPAFPRVYLSKTAHRFGGRDNPPFAPHPTPASGQVSAIRKSPRLWPPRYQISLTWLFPAELDSRSRKALFPWTHFVVVCFVSLAKLCVCTVYILPSLPNTVLLWLGEIPIFSLLTFNFPTRRTFRLVRTETPEASVFACSVRENACFGETRVFRGSPEASVRYYTAIRFYWRVLK